MDNYLNVNVLTFQSKDTEWLQNPQTHIYMHICVYIHLYIHVCVYPYMCVSYIYICKYMYVCVCVCRHCGYIRKLLFSFEKHTNNAMIDNRSLWLDSGMLEPKAKTREILRWRINTLWCLLHLMMDVQDELYYFLFFYVNLQILWWNLIFKIIDEMFEDKGLGIKSSVVWLLWFCTWPHIPLWADLQHCWSCLLKT